MAVYLSPGVYPVEIDLSILPNAVGALVPAFIGTANKGPIQKPIWITNAQQFIDTFGNPFPESYLGYAVLAYFDQGNSAYVLRVGVPYQEGQPAALTDIAIDVSGARTHGWGTIPIYTGIDFGKICSRVIDATHPIIIQAASETFASYNDIDVGASAGAANFTLTFSGTYTGAISDGFTVLITSDPTPGSLIAGASFEVIRNSDGATILSGVLSEASPGISNPITLPDGIIFTIHNAGGTLPLGNQDSFHFSVLPDNRIFEFAVDRTTSGSTGSIYQLGAATYTTATAFAVAINALLAGNEMYKAIAQDDGTVCFTTNIAGFNIQLTNSEAFAIEIGQQLYAYDIPRSVLQSTTSGPYFINSNNNRVSINVINSDVTTALTFNVPVGTLTPQALASAISLGGILNGVRYWDSWAMFVPGGDIQVFIETTEAFQFASLQMLATTAYYSTLLFAETLDMLYPYLSNYRPFNDPRTVLPASSSITPSEPQSCVTAPFSAQCTADAAYFQNIVGWFVAPSPGTWINSYKLSLQPYVNGPVDAAGLFSILITDQNNQLLDRIDNVSFDTTAARYVANVVNPGSTFGGANGDAFVNWIPRPSFLNNDPINNPSQYEVRVPGSFNNFLFVGGENGIPLDPAYSSELDAAIIGNPSDASGLYAFQNPERYDITLLIIPGASSGAVIGAGLQLCQTRGDCMMIVDPPFGLRAQQVVDWHNGMLYSDLAQAINSSYGALYYPWLKIFDQFSSENIFIPPSGHVSSAYAFTAETTEEWFAPAGLRRGHLLTPIDVEVDLTQGERDLLYGFGNAVNPIVNFPQDGITIWGQRTLQRIQSALDRVNVRLLLIYIKKNAIQFLRDFVFEQNDVITRANVVSVSIPFLADIQARRGLTGFAVVCDERNNTPQRIDANELHVAYFLQPTRVAEFIQLDLVIMKTSQSFSSAEVLAAGGVVTTTT